MALNNLRGVPPCYVLPKCEGTARRVPCLGSESFTIDCKLDFEAPWKMKE